MATNIRIIFIAIIAFLGTIYPAVTHAFSVDTYAPASALASGRWVKISVSTTGMHFIPASSLRSWGFSGVENVAVYGYGGERIPDLLNKTNYKDDLPEVQTITTADGIYFYAKGPMKWSRSKDNRFTHTLNPFSTVGYYFVSDIVPAKRTVEAEGEARESDNAATTYTAMIGHELDEVYLSQSGHMMFGEDFRYTPSRNFNFSLPSKKDDSTVWMSLSFATKTTSVGYLDLTVNGENISGNSRPTIGATTGNNAANRIVSRKELSIEGTSLDLGITYSCSGVVNAANLDAIDLNYTANLEHNGTQTQFTLNSTAAKLANADGNVTVWDVTDPLNIVAMNTTATADGGLAWVNSYTGWRNYVAWNASSSFPQPQYVCAVPNQNLHGITDTPDMLILTTPVLASQAERIANLHRNGPFKLNVLIVDHNLVFDEFTSGMRDVNAYRRFAKMLYDRGNAAGKPLRYLLLMGRATFDNRGLDREMQSLNYPTMATWQTDDGLYENTTFCSDDIMAFLEDDSGASPAGDYCSIAVGRIPARTAQEASDYVDKMIYYQNSAERDQWRNEVMLVADNGNVGIHMEQAESFQTAALAATNDGKNLYFDKVYIDAFPLVGGVCQDARKRQFRLLDNGVMWWAYIGHGDPARLSSEGILSYTDVNNMYQRKYPMFYGATCSFQKWDGPSLSGAEIMALNPRGGVIASISATRSALITENGRLTRAMGQALMRRDDTGLMLPIGEIMRTAKNAIRTTNGGSDNRTRYSLLGDPAMRLVLPSNRVVLESINGEAVTPQTQVTIMARQTITARGYVADHTGSRISDFNGSLMLNIHDAEYSTTSTGIFADDTEGKPVTFDEQGSLLYSGRTQVVNGEWELTLTMPSEVTHNFRPAAMNLYATSSNTEMDAIGCNRDFFVYGFDTSAAPDTLAPVVEYAYLNHPSFTNGGTVNEEPMFMARVRDDVGINLSSAGVGHQMTLKLDDNRSYSDVSLYYTPASDGSPAGTINYPLPTLSNGTHTLTLRVWDTSGNSTSHTLDFFVKEGARPQVFDIYTDVNPAVTAANFYISHDRPDALASVTLSIYDMMGRLVWSAADTDRSNLSATAPITWNLTDLGGNRVPRGIYLYRATVKIDGEEITSEAKRIAVTGR